MKLLYLLVDFFTIIIPFLFSFHPKINFYKTWKAFLLADIVVAVIFIGWDVIFTRLQVWSFNPNYITGIYFLNLPAEEILFFFCIPFSCVFTYYCLDKFYDLSWKPAAENIFCIAFSLCLLIIAFIYRQRLYTAVTLISTACVCIFLKFFANINWFGKIITVYVILLIPFSVVNGILTGTGLKAAVVQYSSAQITGFRLLTIPAEDFIYGFELILLNVFLYKIFSKKFYKIF